jgi:hypothetical protein
MKETDQFANAPLCAFEFMRKIRNTIHNDGIFKEDKKKQKKCVILMGTR